MDAWSMNSMSNCLLPYAISNLVALFLLWLSWKRPRTGILVSGIIFILAGSFNFYTASTTPEVYMQYASWVLFDFYVDFILEYFRNNAGIIVKMIAMGQLWTGTLLLIKKTDVICRGIGRDHFFYCHCTAGVRISISSHPGDGVDAFYRI